MVVATGARTEQGAIASSSTRRARLPTPLQARLGGLARWMVVLGVGVAFVLGAAMLARGRVAARRVPGSSLGPVAAVPEGLAATVTMAGWLGSREMAQRGAIVRTLSAIETIGEATVRRQDRHAHENRLRLERQARRWATGRTTCCGLRRPRLRRRSIPSIARCSSPALSRG